MMKHSVFPIFAGLILSVSAGEYFYLSYSLNQDTVYFPGQKHEFELSKDKESYTENGHWYASFSFCMGEHGGTHLDAPYHFYKEGWTVDQIPQSHLVDVIGVAINVKEKVFSLENPDEYKLSVEDIIAYESINGRIPSNAVILLYTGWAKNWSNKLSYLGWRNGTEGETLHFPGVSEEAAKWLVNERDIIGFGLDTPSVDIGNSKGHYPVHVLFGKNQIYNIENVANLHLLVRKINSSGCQLRLFVLPIKITGGTGGPATVLAYC